MITSMRTAIAHSDGCVVRSVGNLVNSGRQGSWLERAMSWAVFRALFRSRWRLERGEWRGEVIDDASGYSGSASVDGDDVRRP